MVLRRKPGAKREQVKMAENFYNEELHEMYSLFSMCSNKGGWAT